MDYNPSGKIQRVAGGSLQSPGACFSCGNGSQAVYALIGWTEYDGAFYLCETCVLSAMTVFPSLMLPGNEKVLRDEIASLERKNESLQTQLVKEKNLNDSYRTVFSNTGIAAPGPSRVPGVARPASDSAVGDTTLIANGFAESDERHPKPANQPDEQPGFAGFDPDEDDIAGILAATAIGDGGPVQGDERSPGNSGESTNRKGRNGGSSTGRAVDRDRYESVASTI